MLKNIFETIINSKEQLCAGCFSFFHSNKVINCNLPPAFTEKIYCPCTKCLLKVVCKESCEKFDDFNKNFTKNKHYIRALSNLYEEGIAK